MQTANVRHGKALMDKRVRVTLRVRSLCRERVARGAVLNVDGERKSDQDAKKEQKKGLTEKSGSL